MAGTCRRLGWGLWPLAKITQDSRGSSRCESSFRAFRVLLGLDSGTGVMFCLLDFLRWDTASVLEL